MIDRGAWWAGVVLALVVLVWWCARLARAEGRSPETEIEELAGNIRGLQPRVSNGRAYRLASIIRDACVEHSITPRLVVAIIMRESSYDPRVESLERVGPRGEIGLMQVMPGSPALALRPSHCTEALETAECQVRTGVAWLARARDHCAGSQWRWVHAYGSGRCEPEEIAASSRGVVRLRSILRQLGSDGALEWPCP